MILPRPNLTPLRRRRRRVLQGNLLQHHVFLFLSLPLSGLRPPRTHPQSQLQSARGANEANTPPTALRAVGSILHLLRDLRSPQPPSPLLSLTASTNISAVISTEIFASPRLTLPLGVFSFKQRAPLPLKKFHSCFGTFERFFHLKTANTSPKTKPHRRRTSRYSTFMQSEMTARRGLKKPLNSSRRGSSYPRLAKDWPNASRIPRASCAIPAAQTRVRSGLISTTRSLGPMQKDS
jgi:hypothetical protein